MSKENNLFILWVIFGYVFVTAINEVLAFVSDMAMYGLVYLELSYDILKYLLPIGIVIMYILTTILIIRRINIKSKTDGIYFTKFPTKSFIVAALVTSFLYFIGNRIGAFFGEAAVDLKSMDSLDWIKLYGGSIAARGYSKWIIFVSLTVVYLRKLNN